MLRSEKVAVSRKFEVDTKKLVERTGGREGAGKGGCAMYERQ